MHITANTILYNLAFLVLGVITQVGTALLLNEIHSKLYRKITQSFMFLPYFISYVVLGVLVYNIFSYDTGLLNNIRGLLGMEKFSAYTDTGIWKYVLVFLEQWKGLGYGVVVYMAAITGISAEYYESARIDGASHWQEIRYISLPLLKPTIIIITLFAVGKIMKGQFELFYQVIGSNGVLFNATDIIDTYVFRSLTQTFDVGLGSAAGFYQSLFGLLFIMAVNGIVKRMNPEYALFKEASVVKNKDKSKIIIKNSGNFNCYIGSSHMYCSVLPHCCSLLYDRVGDHYPGLQLLAEGIKYGCI